MKRRLRQIPILSIVVLLISSLVDAGTPVKEKKEKKETTDNYFPLQQGNEWHFERTAPGKPVSVVYRIGKIENINGVDLARLDVEIDGTSFPNAEHLRQSDKGVFRHRLSGVEVDPPLCILRYPAKPGDKWGGEITVGTDKGAYGCETVEENIEVAAGKFKAMRVNLRLDYKELTVKVSYWFVKDIGYVKQTFDFGGAVAVQHELHSFQPQK
jgi:hypothetical protein